MKQRILILLALLTGATTIAVAQGGGGGFQRRTPEERVATIHAKLDSAFKLEASKLTALDTALVALYRKQDQKMQEMFAGGPGSVDRETMMAERKKYTDAQDEMLKAVLTEEQYKIWKDSIEPAMRPRGFGGGGGGNRGNN